MKTSIIKIANVVITVVLTIGFIAYYVKAVLIIF